MTRRDICQNLIDVYKRKNKDYGNSAHRTFVEFGEVALVIRISDKLSRLQTLLDGGERQVGDESVLDTLGDAVTYLCMLCADMDCDMPELPDYERMENDENIEQTILLLQSLEEPSTQYDCSDRPSSYWRTVLLHIWRGVIDTDLRIEEYMFLADELIDFMTNWSDDK